MFFLFLILVALVVPLWIAGLARRLAVYLGMDGETAFIIVLAIGLGTTMVACWLFTRTPKRQHQAYEGRAKTDGMPPETECDRIRERGEAEQRAIKGHVASARLLLQFADTVEADIDGALRNDPRAIDMLRSMRKNDNISIHLSEGERNRVDNLLQEVKQREDAKKAAEQQAVEEADRQRAAQLKAAQEQAARDAAERQRKAEESRREAAAAAAVKRQAEETQQADMWRGTGGPPKRGTSGTGWIRETWSHEERDFTPWLARELHLVSACTGLDLRHGRMEVSAGGGRADIVARDHKSNSNVVIENQLDVADLNHRKQLALYGEALNAGIRIWIAADFSSTIRREVRKQNRQNESRSDGPIYYLLKLRPDRRSPLALIVGPANSQAHMDFTDVPLVKRNKEGING